ncbi:tRNA wybutosine-synthesizing protein [Apiospora arundinis]
MAGATTTISEDFAARKRKILAQLAVPDDEYTDASPKGTVDAGIRDLIDELNGLDGFVTTSSCGGGLVHFKFEPMILHVLTASPAHAQLLLRCGLQAGFRESGAINLTATTGGGGVETTPTPMVAIRCMGLTFESLVGVKKEGSGGGEKVECTVPPAYLRTLVDVGNERFAENTRRIQRFRSAVLEATAPASTGPKMKGDGSIWEDAETRRERKKAEGLKRKAALQNQQQSQGDQSVGNTVATGDDDGVDLSMNTPFT